VNTKFHENPSTGSKFIGGEGSVHEHMDMIVPYAYHAL
jgi:hypothetical protein